MRLATYRADDGPRLGVIVGEQILDVSALVGLRQVTDMLSLIDLGAEGLARLRQDLEVENGPILQRQNAAHNLADVHLLAPIQRPRKNIFCMGQNYADHAAEHGAAVAAAPILFSKATTTVNGPYDPIEIDPAVSDRLDWEVELGVIIGRAGKNIPAERALDYVFGYTVINDISARDLQFRHKQWFKGKSLDGSCPMGPWIVTADEIPDPHALNLRLRVNGVTKQDANTSLMVFNLPAIIEALSAGLTLEPGDIIATGTPAGVGDARTPPEYLQPGDVVEAEIDGIGTLRNPVTRAEA
ncbi:MAG TPA: fumarylacetoacetate hydrolase family protein [Ktedonobacterales bacterium]|nr:fumarylacetoacetate hydrolase family protein [Ktedonobacterales bacterium]